MSLSSVLTLGFAPATDASSSQIVLMGYGTTGEAPPTPPPDEAPGFYGPALTPAERRRWFSDKERERIFESPLAREARRQARERLGRIEIGLITEEVSEEEAQEVVETAVEQKIAKAPVPRSREDAKALAKKVADAVAADMKAERQRRKAEEADMQEEEREALAILSGLMFMD